uniref:DNA2/NAM7 helicase helicase domain-containing protein n=2 Tax=Aegilops tauschii subsp. strangulata TaxID=200361 RepID=A0A453EMH6_AEGTS
MAALQGLQTKTLVCASTYSDFSSLCCCLDDLIRKSGRYDGADPKFGDVVLLCDLLEVKNDNAKQFCLEWRLQEIMPCMVWKSKIDGLISLLEKEFREMYTKVTAEADKKNLSALALLKKVFKYKSDVLIKLLDTIWLHSPSDVSSQRVAKGLAALFDALATFNNLLSIEAVTENDVKIAFECASITSSRVKFSTVKSRNKHRQPMSANVKEIRRSKDKCVEQLEYVKRVLNFPHTKNVEWMRRYLIEESKILLSTPSDAHGLHYVSNDKIRMLIVIGAAQIKECEVVAAFSLPSIGHISLIGDDAQLCSPTKSEVSHVILQANS